MINYVDNIALFTRNLVIKCVFHKLSSCSMAIYVRHGFRDVEDDETRRNSDDITKSFMLTMDTSGASLEPCFLENPEMSGCCKEAGGWIFSQAERIKKIVKKWLQDKECY